MQHKNVINARLTAARIRGYAWGHLSKAVVRIDAPDIHSLLEIFHERVHESNRTGNSCRRMSGATIRYHQSIVNWPFTGARSVAASDRAK